MSMHATDETILRAYLLGDLADEEQERQEERLLTDKGYFERLLLVEEDLVDEYASGELLPGEREKVERRFLLSSGRQDRLRLAVNLQRYAFEHATPAQETSGKRFLPVKKQHRASVLLLCAALLIVAVGAGLVIKLVRLNRGLEVLDGEKRAAVRSATDLNNELNAQAARGDELARKLEHETERRIQLERQAAKLRQLLSRLSASREQGLLALSLLPGRLRDGGPESVIEIPRSARALMLYLSVESDRHRSYRAALKNDEGVAILVRNALTVARTTPDNKQDDKQVVIRVPVRLLRPGDYTVLLSPTNSQERGVYYFTATRQK